MLRELVDAIRYATISRRDAPRVLATDLQNVAALIDGAAETVVDEGGEIGLTPLDLSFSRAMLVAGIETLDADPMESAHDLHNARGWSFLSSSSGSGGRVFPLAQSFDQPRCSRRAALVLCRHSRADESSTYPTPRPQAKWRIHAIDTIAVSSRNTRRDAGGAKDYQASLCWTNVFTRSLR